MFVSFSQLPTSAVPFVRFVVGAEHDNVDELHGPFRFDCALDDPSLEEWERAALEEMYAWFNAHLKVPPFSQFNRKGPFACWFRSDAGEPIRRMWDLVALVRELGWPARFVRSNDPGELVYFDEHQIVARRKEVRPTRGSIYETSISIRSTK